MTPDEFVKAFYLERKHFLETYYSGPETDVSNLIQSMDLDPKNHEKLRQIIGSVLRDSFYTVLLGLDGAANIGGNQELYKLEDEKGNELTGGEIEAAAYDYFHDLKYEKEHTKADFIAELTFLTTKEGGRQTPVFSGYRGQVQFAFDEVQTSGEQKYIDRERVFPGETVVAQIRILGVDYFKKRLSDGMPFEFKEGARLIGTGKILHILNPELKI